MKGKNVMMVLGLGLLMLVVAVTAVPQVTQAQGTNLLKNPGFEEGHFSQDGIAEITVPNGWRMHWSNGESKIFGGYAETARPETVVWNIAGAPEKEKNVFWRDGIYTVKIFKGWAPLWAAMSQDVSGLQAGRRYRLVAPVFIDMVADYQGGKKIAPQDGRQGRVRLGASPIGTAWRDEANIAYSGWWTGETISPFYQAYPTFVYEFTATAPDMTVWIEMASNYPHPNNGFFVDTVGLFALDEIDNSVSAPAPPAGGGQSGGGGGAVAPAPKPVATPRADGSVVHIIQSGDSFWSLAIQYAKTMGIPPEEALTAIPELNNNPAVLNSGQELLIVAPSPEGAAAAAAAAEGGETTEDEAAAESEAETNAEDAEDTQSATDTTGQEAESEDGTSTIAEVLPNITAGSICVGAFLDEDADNTRDESEVPVAENAITLAKDGNTLSTYVTNNSDDLYCFENLDAGTYQVQIYPSADYMVAADDSWAVAVAEGVMLPVSFPLQYAPADTAVAAAGDTGTGGSGDGSDTAVALSNPAESSDAAVDDAANPLSGNIGLIVVGAAVVLVLLAGAGIVLLRRG